MSVRLSAMNLARQEAQRPSYMRSTTASRAKNLRLTNTSYQAPKAAAYLGSMGSEYAARFGSSTRKNWNATKYPSAAAYVQPSVQPSYTIITSKPQNNRTRINKARNNKISNTKAANTKARNNTTRKNNSKARNNKTNNNSCPVCPVCPKLPPVNNTQKQKALNQIRNIQSLVSKIKTNLQG